ncbi:HAMP domain-containing protein [Nocardioides sp. W3-2-3]|uniref:ATP-binding protein n=1 Tax=Nocardioides convexus TaxID=2712224 RepID=UPI00241822C1|nr:ATP-binding protein [Nocardioides convexus]NHA01103.1 HAMP domain-containing protein [Nocardioides convexus]
MLEDRTEAVIGSATTGPGGRLVVPDSRLDAGVAVYDATGRLVAGSAPSADAEQYAALATTPRTRTVEPSGTDERRIRAKPFRTSAGTRGVVVVTERTAPYERGERLALLVCIGAGGLMIVLAAGLALWVSRRALAPVVAMTRSADDWSEHDLGMRFDPGPGGNELATLGRTLDRLLERVAHAIRSEQRLTSEPGARFADPADRRTAQRGPAAARPGPEPGHPGAGGGGAGRRPADGERDREPAGAWPGPRPARPCPAPAGWSTRSPRRSGPATMRASRWTSTRRCACCCRPRSRRARSRRSSTTHAGSPAAPWSPRACTAPASLALYVDDDGPGIGPAERERVFEPGRTTGAGAGLGLPLSRRIARSMGGDVTVGDGPLATRLVITLPTP